MGKSVAFSEYFEKLALSLGLGKPLSVVTAKPGHTHRGMYTKLRRLKENKYESASFNSDSHETHHSAQAKDLNARKGL